MAQKQCYACGKLRYNMLPLGKRKFVCDSCLHVIPLNFTEGCRLEDHMCVKEDTETLYVVEQLIADYSEELTESSEEGPTATEQLIEDYESDLVKQKEESYE